MKKFICILSCFILAFISLSFTACTADDNTCEYEIKAVYNEETHSLSATLDFTFYNYTDDPVQNLKFNVFPNAYRKGATHSPIATPYAEKAYYSGESYGEMQISNVQNCKSWTICGVDDGILLVQLNEQVYPKQTQKIRVEYVLNLALVNHRTGVGETSISLANFYPTLCYYGKTGFKECTYYSLGDPYVSECASFKLTLTVPNAYSIACSGKKMHEKTEGNLKTEWFSAEKIRDFTIILSKNFTLLQAKVSDINVNYYYVNDEDAKSTVDAACSGLKYFSNAFGKYPYDIFTLVQTDLYYGGMEYGALATIDKTLTSRAKIYTTIHEIAHMWWAETVGSDQTEYAWLDEGLAEYSAFLFFNEHKDYGFTKVALVGEATKAYRAYYTVYNQIFGETDTTMNRSLKDFAGEYEYVNIAYNKGALLFESLYGLLGEKKFLKCLSEYYTQYAFKVATPQALTRIFEKSEPQTKTFLAAFINGKIIV